MALTTLQKTQLNNSNEAMQRAQVGTLLGNLESAVLGEGTSGIMRKYTQTVLFSQFTDGGAAVGTFDLSVSIPAKATFMYSAITAITGFTGNVSAVMTIGDGTDVDRYNTGTPSVFATAANGVAAGIPSGVVYHDTAKTPKLTVTTSSDFTAVNAGAVTVSLYYLV